MSDPVNAAVSQSAIGPDDDILAYTSSDLHSGLIIDGGVGTDTLLLQGGGAFRLSGIATFANVEIVQGSAANDGIDISNERLTGVSTLDGGAGTDILSLALDNSFDFRGKTIKGFESIEFIYDEGEAIFDDKAAAMSMTAGQGQGHHLVLENAAFTNEERQSLFERGMDKITDASGIYVSPPLQFENLDGDIVKEGRFSFIDAVQNVRIVNASSTFRTLVVQLVDGYDLLGTLGIDTSGDVKLLDAPDGSRAVQVDGTIVGSIKEAASIYLSIDFNANATAALVQKLVSALTFDSKTLPEPSMRQEQIAIHLTDSAGREAQAVISIEPISTGPISTFPTEAVMSKGTVAEISTNGTEIGTLSVVDPGEGDTFTYSLLDSAGGRFKIEGNKLLVANGIKLDFEQAQSHQITVQVKTSTGHDFEQILTVSVNDVVGEFAKGSAGSDFLKGGLGNDTLDGGAGADTLIGGLDNDTYIVDIEDAIQEGADDGIDTIIASFSFDLGGYYVENLTLTGGSNIDGVGNSSANVLLGNNGDNLLRGNGGDDTIDGGAGLNTVVFSGALANYTIVRNADGSVLITDGQSDHDGSDVLKNIQHARFSDQELALQIEPANSAPSNISLSQAWVKEMAVAGTEIGTLAATDADGDALTFSLISEDGTAASNSPFEIKNGKLVVKDGSKLDFEVTQFHTIKVRVSDGTDSREASFIVRVEDVAETIKGAKGNDVLKGTIGADKIYGGYGNDNLTGGLGQDVFVFNTKLGTAKTDRKVNFDKIVDFNVVDDTLLLDNAIFKKLGTGTELKPGKLSEKFFKVGTKAADKDDYLIYNKKTGVLSYDSDGSGSKAAIEFAQLTKNLKMTCKDFFIV